MTCAAHRATMEEDLGAAGERERGLAAGPVERAGWFASRDAGGDVIALDRRGRLNRERDRIDGGIPEPHDPVIDG